MEKLAENVRLTLSNAFQGIDVQVSVNKPLRKLSGIVIWSGFDGVDQMDRQTKMWNVINAAFTQEERSHIGAILTLTPKEKKWAEDPIAA